VGLGIERGKIMSVSIGRGIKMVKIVGTALTIAISGYCNYNETAHLLRFISKYGTREILTEQLKNAITMSVGYYYSFLMWGITDEQKKYLKEISDTNSEELTIEVF